MSWRSNGLLSVIILTYNEELHIARALQSVSRIASKVFVVDSFSTDGTVDIAQSYGALVVQHEFVNQAAQFQWALDTLPIETQWVMRLDADEELSPELTLEIDRRLPELNLDVTGVNLNRRHIFLDRWIRHGGRYPLTLLRIWRMGCARIEQRWMDEHPVLLRGSAVTFTCDFSDYNLNDLTFFTEKHNKYAMREAVDRLHKEFKLSCEEDAVIKGDSNPQARFKRLIKDKLYNYLPFGVGPTCYFLWRYVGQCGFLDGREGLIYHVLQGFWYRFLVEAKVLELRRAISHLRESSAIKEELKRLTGLAIR